jgi:PAS domain-containing protein
MPPGWDGNETTQRIWEVDPDLQVVICTAYSDYSWSEMFEQLGQRDGLLILKKPFDAVEAFQLAHALTEKWWLHRQSQRKMEELERRVAERTRELQQTNHELETEVAEHRRAEQSLRLLGSAVEQSRESIVITDAQLDLPGPKIIFVNPAFTKMTGYSAEEAIGKTPRSENSLKPSCFNLREWKPWANWPAASRTSSTASSRPLSARVNWCSAIFRQIVRWQKTWLKSSVPPTAPLA